MRARGGRAGTQVRLARRGSTSVGSASRHQRPFEPRYRGRGREAYVLAAMAAGSPAGQHTRVPSPPTAPSTTRILSFDADAVTHDAGLAAESEAKGTVVDMADCQIAAIAVLHDAQVATRNVRHFDYLGVAIVNPWQA